jgi:transposase-like protein
MSKEQRIQAIDIAIARGGGIVRFAEALGVKHQAVYSWKKRGYAPPDRALVMENLFSVPRADTMDPRILAVFAAPQQDVSDLL